MKDIDDSVLKDIKSGFNLPPKPELLTQLQQTLKDPADQEIMNGLSETMKERFQRFQLAYHVRLMYKYENILLVGYHIEEAVYGHRYYYPEYGKSFETPQSWEKEMPSDTILVLLTATPDVIKQRMQNDPHTYSLVPESDIEDVQKEFEQEFRRSWLQKRFQIDTSDLAPDQLLDAFLKQSLPYLNTKDLLFRQMQ